MKMLRPLTLIACAMLMSSAATSAYAASLKLASCFADHMVLQRDRSICIWGDAEAGADVSVSFQSQNAKATADHDGHWEIHLKPIPAGGPYHLAVSAAASNVDLADILVGDVWLCSGQSNMQMPLKECDDANAVAERAVDLPRLRLCTVGKGWNAKPQRTADIRWRKNSPDAARNMSAVAYYFASELLTDPALADVPVGIIDSSFGGTTCEGWIPNDTLKQFAPADLHESMFGIKPGMLYNAMIAPLGHSPIKGVVWYQGESNADHPAVYPALLKAMVSEWRRQFDSPDLPVAIIELPDFVQGGNGLSWAWIREAQTKATAQIPRSSLVTGINTTDGYDLHPKQKHELGRRIALKIRRDAYGEKIVGTGPVFKEAVVEGSSMRVKFDTAGDGLAVSPPGAIRGFAIAGADGEYRFATTTIDGDAVVLHSDRVPEPRTVRYAWSGIPGSTLTNRSRLPSGPFRTDDFSPPDMEIQKQLPARHIATANYELTISADGQATSFAVHGKQFLSNAVGPAGGTSIPFFFGAKSLSKIQELGPDLISFSDDQVALLIAFKPAGMDWTLTNHGKDELTFRIALSPLITVAPQKDDEPFKLTRGKNILIIAGIESVSDSDDGKMLQVKLKPGTETRLSLKIEP